MRRRVFLCSLAGILLLPKKAHLSQVHYTEITLQELVERSELILVVKAAQPPQRQVEIPVGKGRDGKEAPAFTRVIFRYEVKAALTKASGASLVGKIIEVDGAHWEETLSIHKHYYEEGLSISPIYERYHPDHAPKAEKKDAPNIIFLHRTGPHEFAFVVDNAIEHMENRGTIESMIRGKQTVPQ